MAVSGEAEAVQVTHGLPADLSRLRKEQLLDELAKRGLLAGSQCNSKSLKKDLVEALRRGLASQGPGQPAKSPLALREESRKGSQMADFRSLVVADDPRTSQAASASELAGEFQARRNRKSQSATSTAPVTGPLRVEEREEEPRAEGREEERQEDLRAEGMKEEAEGEQKVEVEEQRIEEEQKVEEEQREEEVEEGLIEAAAALAAQTQPRPAPTAVSSAGTAMVKKPSNLLAGQSSFLDKPGPPKTLVPALEKAKQAKAAEEQRLQSKKREQEQRGKAALALSQQLAATASSAASTVVVSPASKPQRSQPATAANASHAATASSKQPQPGKKGLFSQLFGGRKPTNPNPNPVTVPNPNPAPKPIAALPAPKPSSESESAASDRCSSAGSSLGASQGSAHSDSTAAPEAPVAPTPSSASPFASKSNISSIVSAYQQAINSQSAAKAPRPPPPIAVEPPREAPKEAPKEVPKEVSSVEPEEAEYQIVDREDSEDEDSGSGTDEDSPAPQADPQEGEPAPRKKKDEQSIPDWARGPRLKEALERQYGLNGHSPMDPDLIFAEVQTCSLEDIFGCKEGLTRKYASRTSSAHWDADEMTLVEKRVYRKHMGYEAAGAPLLKCK